MIQATISNTRGDLSTRPSEFRLGSWTVRPSLDQIEKDGEVIHLQHLSMRVLSFLADHPGTVVSYDELLKTLWPGRVVGEDAVHRRIAHLRQCLGDDARSPRYIETIQKQGYRVVADVVPLLDPLAGIPLRHMPTSNDVVNILLDSTSGPSRVAIRRYGEQSGKWWDLGDTPLVYRLSRDVWLVRLAEPGDPEFDPTRLLVRSIDGGE